MEPVGGAVLQVVRRTFFRMAKCHWVKFELLVRRVELTRLLIRKFASHQVWTGKMCFFCVVHSRRLAYCPVCKDLYTFQTIICVCGGSFVLFSLPNQWQKKAKRRKKVPRFSSTLLLFIVSQKKVDTSTWASTVPEMILSTSHHALVHPCKLLKHL